MKVKVRHEGVFHVGIRNVDAFDGVLLALLQGARTPARSSPFTDLR